MRRRCLIGLATARGLFLFFAKMFGRGMSVAPVTNKSGSFLVLFSSFYLTVARIDAGAFVFAVKKKICTK